MGMAASQARYLGLTARKTNVEYEGQQINQARTALANQSANLFNQLLTLQVPTAPSTADFTKVQYSYQDGVNAETIESMSQLIGDPTYNYNVTHYHYADIYRGQKELITNPQVAKDASNIPTFVGNAQLYVYTPGDDDTLDSAYDQINSDWNNVLADAGAGNVYYYVVKGRTYFATKADLLHSADSAPDPTKPLENQEKLPSYYAENNKEKVTRTQRAVVEIDGTGRATSIRYEDSSQVFSLKTETITDDNAYNDAMNKYTYDMAVYEKQIQDINAKTAKIQEEDRTLELRLKQLDTEQEALQTEMEAVKKVIDENIKATFKTFES